MVRENLWDQLSVVHAIYSIQPFSSKESSFECVIISLYEVFDWEAVNPTNRCESLYRILKGRQNCEKYSKLVSFMFVVYGYFPSGIGQLEANLYLLHMKYVQIWARTAWLIVVNCQATVQCYSSIIKNNCGQYIQ